MSRDRVRCVGCREPIAADTRICPHCKELQPSPLIDAGIVVTGVFCFVFGFVLGVMTIGPTRIAGFALALVGIGMGVGGYTRYLDRSAERRSRGPS